MLQRSQERVWDSNPSCAAYETAQLTRAATRSPAPWNRTTLLRGPRVTAGLRHQSREREVGEDGSRPEPPFFVVVGVQPPAAVALHASGQPTLDRSWKGWIQSRTL